MLIPLGDREQQTLTLVRKTADGVETERSQRLRVRAAARPFWLAS